MSGGGLSALAYAGFVDELRSLGVEPSFFAGLSGGGFMAPLLAMRMHTDDIIRLCESLLTPKILNTHLTHFEVIDHEALVQKIRSLLPMKMFEELPTRAGIFSTDVAKQRPVFITKGDIASAMVATCGMFPMLAPLKRRGLLLVDGGFTIYYGAKYLRTPQTPKVIGVDVAGLTEGLVKGILRGFFRQVNSAVTSNARYELNSWPVDLDIRITFPTPSFFSFHRKTRHLVSLGRRAAQQNRSKIQTILLA